jgi:hypothetical protein
VIRKYFNVSAHRFLCNVAPSAPPGTTPPAEPTPGIRRAHEAKQRKKSLAYVGIPFVLFLVGGLFFLTEFVQTQVEVKDKRVSGSSKSQRLAELEEEHRIMMQKIDLDNYTLSRIPRAEEIVQKENKKKA